MQVGEVGMLLGAIEAGGTKFVCGVGDADGSRETARIATTTPDETFAAVRAFFDAAEKRHGAITGLGIASFGPVRLDPAAADHGRLLRTPKPGWEGADLLAGMGRGVPVALDTDVNAAALAEARAAGLDDLCYVTVGTGIGVGVVANGRPVHGFAHPEAGHILVRRHAAHGDFPGTCPYHGDCLEGLANGPSILAAWGATPSDLGAGHPFWTVEADYLAQLCTTLVLTLSPRRIVLGGGVMSHAELFPPVRAAVREKLAGYVLGLDEAEAVQALIVPPVSVEPPGLVGAYLLAAGGLANRGRRP